MSFLYVLLLQCFSSQLYFSYVRQLVNVIGTYRDPLDEEWIAAKEICTEITNGEVEAGLCFRYTADQL